MKRFFLFIGLLTLLVAAIDFALSHLFDAIYVRTRSGQTGGEINRYVAMADTPELLIMGNSRARYQVNPDSFSVYAYSLCHAGMSQVFQTGLLQVLVHEKKLPRTILLHVDFEEFTKEDYLVDMGNLRYYYGRIPEITSGINDVSTYERVKYVFRMYRYNGRIINTLKNYFQSGSASYTGNGYENLKPIPTDTTTFAEPPPDRGEPPVRFHYETLRHIEAFIEICKRNNVQLLCFTSPYYLPRSYGIAGRTLDSLLLANEVPYFNASEHPLPVLMEHATYWQDGEHLNELGAGYFSRQAADWCEPYLESVASKRRLPRE